MTAKISACLIVRNERSNIYQCLQSLRPHVDELIVVDTGSTDDTKRIAAGIADRVETFIGCNDDDGNILDFAMARNYAHSLASHEWVFWCDGDDVVHGAEHLRQMAADGDSIDRCLYMMPYHYSFDPSGRCTCIHWRERLVKKNRDFKWTSPVHEVMMPRDDKPVTAFRTDLVWVEHKRDKIGKSVDPERNARILKAWVKGEGKDDVRAWFYLGLELRRLGQEDDAVRWLTQYVEKTGWADEKCLAQLELAQMALHNGDWKQAITYANEARLTKSWPDPYFVMGRAMYELAEAADDDELKRYEFGRAAHQMQLGTNIWSSKKQDTVLFHNPQGVYLAQHFLAPCLANLGMYEAAVQACDIGLSGMPESEHLKGVRTECLRRSYKTQIVKLCEQLIEVGGIRHEHAMVIDKALAGDVAVRYKSALKPPKPADGKLDIVFYTGPAWEDWTPATLEREGLGGSETMCIELAKRLAAMGHAVRVFGQPGVEAEFDDAQYLQHEGFDGPECDVLVASRMPDAVDNSRARLNLLWVHDVHCGSALTRERAMRFDRVLALSQWHKDFLLSTYPFLDADRIEVTRNGIDLAKFNTGVERIPTRAIYSSSPDRGLLLALQCWPRILEQVPEAELHVFYGFNNWEKVAEHDPVEAEKLAEVRQALASTPRVFHHGRVGPKRLAEEFQKSGVWYYPTWFYETSCISAVQAQAAGCWPVTTARAALRETVKSGSWIDLDDRGIEYGSAEHQDWIVRRTVNRMGKLTALCGRDVIRAYVQDYDLDALAQDWQTSFYALLEELEGSGVHAYKEFVA